jgi:AcrR family transcriptional regulator
MSESVKRRYTSSVREEQARATRRAIVWAAAGLFVDHGFGATTVDAIAQAARVSRKTVFTSVGSKVEALKLAYDWAIVGDDEPIPLMQREMVQRAQLEPNPRVIIAEYAAFVGEVSARVARIARVIQTASGSDPGVAALAAETAQQRLTGMRAMAGMLRERGFLKPSLDVEQAADILWLHNDPNVYHRLVIERGWPPDRFVEWLGDTLVFHLL